MKQLSLFFAIIFMPIMASAYDAYIDGIYYNFDHIAKTAKVTANFNHGNSTYSGIVDIPSLVYFDGDLYSVTSIGTQAFMGCADLTYVTIPNSVTCIESWAFFESGWYNNQPDGIIYLDNWLIGVKGEELIGKVTIAEGTRGIANGAFSGCSGLTSITIPNSVTSIGSYAFGGCSSLISITIPDGVTSIENGTFSYCESLTTITIPNSVICIKDGDVIGSHGIIRDYGGAFRGCTSLTSVTIPNNVTSLGNGTFSGCI